MRGSYYVMRDIQFCRFSVSTGNDVLNEPIEAKLYMVQIECEQCGEQKTKIEASLADKEARMHNMHRKRGHHDS